MMYFSYQEGRVAPDNNIGRFISDTVASIPKISPAAFDRLVNDSLQVRLSCLLVLHLTFGPIIQGTGKTSARSLQNLPSVLLLVQNRFLQKLFSYCFWKQKHVSFSCFISLLIRVGFREFKYAFLIFSLMGTLKKKQ